MYIKGGVDSPAGPANAIPLSKTVYGIATPQFSPRAMPLALAS